MAGQVTSRAPVLLILESPNATLAPLMCTFKKMELPAILVADCDLLVEERVNGGAPASLEALCNNCNC